MKKSLLIALLVVTVSVAGLATYLQQTPEGPRVAATQKRQTIDTKERTDFSFLFTDTSLSFAQKKEIIANSTILNAKGKKKLLLALQDRLKPKVPFDKPKEASLYFLQKRKNQAGEIPVSQYLNTAAQFKSKQSLTQVIPTVLSPAAKQAGGMEANLVNPMVDNFFWSNIGPGNVGGRTRAILVQDTTPHTIYAGGVAGESGNQQMAGQVGLP